MLATIHVSGADPDTQQSSTCTRSFGISTVPLFRQVPIDAITSVEKHGGKTWQSGDGGERFLCRALVPQKFTEPPGLERGLLASRLLPNLVAGCETSGSEFPDAQVLESVIKGYRVPTESRPERFCGDLQSGMLALVLSHARPKTSRRGQWRHSNFQVSSQ